MSDGISNPGPGDAAARVAELRSRLLAGAERLQGLDHLEADDQVALANLVRELADLLDPHEPAEQPEQRQLAEQSAELIGAIEARHDTGLIAAARDRLEEAAARAEAAAPVTTGVVRQLIDALAGIGI
jgi:hypothetical protein